MPRKLYAGIRVFRTGPNSDDSPRGTIREHYWDNGTEMAIVDWDTGEIETTPLTSLWTYGVDASGVRRA